MERFANATERLLTSFSAPTMRTHRRTRPSGYSSLSTMRMDLGTLMVQMF